MKQSVIKIVIAPIIFVLVLVLSQVFFDWARVDLTQEQVYSLSDGTKNIIADIEQPIEFTLYYSDKASKDLTALRSYAQRVKEVLQEYALLSEGKIELSMVDPEPFSEAEDQAAEAGLQSVPIATGDSIYLGLHAKNEDGSEAQIPFFQPDREAFLEYEISELIQQLSQPMNPVVAVYSELDVAGGFDMHHGGRTPPWTVYEQMEQRYDVRMLDESMDDLNNSVELLVLIQPKELDEKAIYKIDQYAMSGGKVVVFVDPKSETAQHGMMDPDNASVGLNPLQPLFEAWGVDYQNDQVVLDKALGLTVSVGQGKPPVRHLGIIGAGVDNLNANEVITADLESINLSSTGYLQPIENASTTFDSLLWSSTNAQLMEVNQYNMLATPERLQQSVVDSSASNDLEEEQSYIFAARLSGVGSSAFEQSILDSTTEDAETSNHIANTDKLNVIIVADTDLLTDRMWVQVESFFGRRILQPWADNGAFAINTFEQFIGSSDLIAIRSRGRFTRPFTQVESLKYEAEARYLDNERRLQEQLQQTEQRLAELQEQQTQGSVMLNPEQQQALAEFQQEKLAIRKALRDVRHELDKDIERLGTYLKVINIALAPSVLVALLWIIARRRIRR